MARQLSKTNKFDQFEQTLRTDITTAVITVAQAAVHKALTGQQLADLSTALKNAYPTHFSENLSKVPDPGYGVDFDLTEEVNSQIAVVRALRQRIINDNGGLNKDISAREAKELISSGNTMLQSLMKFHDKIINHSRMQAIEAATIDAVKDLPKEQQEIFFAALEDALEQVA